MAPRLPAVAGQFYPCAEASCRRTLEELFAGGPEAGGGRVVGGIAPHAGWVFSGAVDAAVIRAATRGEPPETIVIFGAVHVRSGPVASVYPYGAWQTPLGEIDIDGELAAMICDATRLVAPNADVHAAEHSIEVIVPFAQYLAPEAALLPIMVPPTDDSADVGRAVASVCAASGRGVLYIGSSDLTHYGPAFGFAPHGVGKAGLAWAKDVNDRRMIDLMRTMRGDHAVSEARAHQNACGPGAIAATIAACQACGAMNGTLLKHTHSHEVLGNRFGEESADSVGYAGVVFQ